MKPYTLRMDEELPVATLPDLPKFSENYAYIGYDYEKKIGYGAYIGRWVKNPRLWREQLYLYLPDGTVLSHIAIGKGRSETVPSGGSLEFHCEGVGGRWRISFEGAMRHDNLQRLLKEPIWEATPHNVVFDVVVDHPYPVWMFPTSDNSSYGKFHYEQMGTCKGAIEFDGQRHEFASSAAYRDHSRGPRQLGDYDGHVWLQLYFPNSAPFSTYQVWHNTNGENIKVLDQAVAIHGDRFGEAKLLSDVRLPSLDNLLDPIKVEVSVEGKEYNITGRPLNTFVSSLTEDFDFFYGCTPSLGHFYATEHPLLFEDGPGGPIYGYIQRSGRFPAKK